LLTAIGIMALGLLAVMLRGSGAFSWLGNPVISLSLLIVGATAVISILLPYAAENYPVGIRGRATGWVAGWSKIGGLVAQGIGALGMVPAVGPAAAIVAAPAILSLLLIAISGRETRGRDLQELETAGAKRRPSAVAASQPASPSL